MKPPICRLCEKGHWGACQHFPVPRAGGNVGRRIERIARETVLTEVSSNKKGVKVIKRATSRAVTAKKQGWDRAKYNEYQSKLMRERRAKQKGNHHED